MGNGGGASYLVHAKLSETRSFYLFWLASFGGSHQPRRYDNTKRPPFFAFRALPGYFYYSLLGYTTAPNFLTLPSQATKPSSSNSP